MEGQDAGAPKAPAVPLFVLELDSYGGTLAPTSVAELQMWIDREVNHWSWVRNPGHFGPHDHGYAAAVHALRKAAGAAESARQQIEAGDAKSAQTSLAQCQNLLLDAAKERALPHSSSLVGRRVEVLRQQAGELTASFYLSVFVPGESNSLKPTDLFGFRGVIEGMVDRYSLGNEARRLEGIESAVVDRMEAFDSFASQKKQHLEDLHRAYEDLARTIATLHEQQATMFADRHQKQFDEFQTQLASNAKDMEGLRKSFVEEMALRAPVKYWSTKGAWHAAGAVVTGVLSFAGIGLTANYLAERIPPLIAGNPPGSTAESWRIAAVAIIGVFAVWGLRLLVRMFLSQLHLAGDARERVVMVKTYLSLLEGDKLADKEDRQLILQALFRPTSDGIVKDEGIPISLPEVITRTNKP